MMTPLRMKIQIPINGARWRMAGTTPAPSQVRFLSWLMVETGGDAGNSTEVISGTMGCCCSKQSSAAFGGDGQRLGTADEERGRRAAAAAEKRFTDQPVYTDANLTDEERAKIRAERLAAVEARMTKQEKQAMKQKKKPTNDEPLRGPNSQNTMRWTAG